MSTKQNYFYRKSLFVDFHNPEFLEEAFEEFNAKEYIRLIKSLNPDMVMFWANDHYGNCFYDTKIGHKHSRLKTDYFGELVEEAHKNDIAVFAYFVVGWHNYSAIKHPDWEQIGSNGKPWKRLPSFYWKWVCLNSPQRQYCIDQMKEIVKKYDIEGVWIDILFTIPCGCYCQYCQMKFKRTYGTSILQNPEPASLAARRIVNFRYRNRYDFLTQAKEELEKIKPSLILTYNCSGDIVFSDLDSDNLVDKLSQERHLWKSRWAKTQGKPFEFLITRGYYAWSDWTIKPLDRLRAETSTVLANGGGILLGDHGNPNGTLEPYVYKNLSIIFKEIDKIEEWTKDSESISDVAVLHSVRSHKMKQWLLPDTENYFAVGDLLSEMQGAYKVLIEGKKQFEIISEEKLSDIRRYNTLIIPNQLYLSKKDCYHIEDFVRRGGSLISTYQTGLYGQEGKLRENFVLNEIIGTDYLSESHFSIDYIDNIDDCLESGLPKIPLLISPRPVSLIGQDERKQPASLFTRVNDSRILARITHPSCERTAEHWVSHTHSNPHDRTEHPAIIYNKYGRGRSVYITLPIFKAYWNTLYHPLRNLVLNIIQLLNPESLIEVSAPLGVEVVVTKRDNNLIIHLVNMPQWELGREVKGLQEILPIFGIGIRLHAPQARKVFLPLLKNKSLPFEKRRDFISFKIPELRVHQIAVVD